MDNNGNGLLSSRAMLAILSISGWSGEILDHNATNEFAEAKGAETQMVKLRKKLLEGDELFRAIHVEDSRARASHKAQTLPWSDSGARILTAANYFNYVKLMTEHRISFLGAVEKFIQNSGDSFVKSLGKLGQLGNEKEFPSVDRLKAKYNFKLRFAPLPDANDFRVTLTEDQVDAIKQQITSDLHATIGDAVRDLYLRLHTEVSGLADSLSNPRGKYKSRIEHIRETCDIVSRLNVTNDKQLENFRLDILQKLGNEDGDFLRKNEAARHSTAFQAQKIADDMAAFMK